MPKASQRSLSGCQASRVVATVPIITSEWPERYLVAAISRDVGAQRERPVLHARTPGVVRRQQRAARMRQFGQLRQVAHLVDQRARALGVHQPRGRLEEFLDAAAVRREEGAADAVGVEKRMHEVARGLVHAVGHQHVVAGLQVRQQHHADGRKAGGKEARAVGAFEFADRVFEREGGGRAACAVAEGALVAAARAGLAHGGHAVEQHGACAHQRRVDGRAAGIGGPPCRCGEARVQCLRGGVGVRSRAW
jgi:hypothetical protein